MKSIEAELNNWKANIGKLDITTGLVRPPFITYLVKMNNKRLGQGSVYKLRHCVVGNNYS